MRNGELRFEVIELVEEANAIEIFIPPPLALLLEILAPDLDRESRFENVGEVKPGLSSSQRRLLILRPVLLIVLRVVQIFQLREGRDIRSQGVEEFQLGPRPQAECVGVSRWIDSRIVPIATTDFDLATNRERAAEHIELKLAFGPSLASAFREYPAPFRRVDSSWFGSIWIAGCRKRQIRPEHRINDHDHRPKAETGNGQSEDTPNFIYHHRSGDHVDRPF